MAWEFPHAKEWPKKIIITTNLKINLENYEKPEKGRGIPKITEQVGGRRRIGTQGHLTLFIYLFGATLVAYGSSQARDPCAFTYLNLPCLSRLAPIPPPPGSLPDCRGPYLSGGEALSCRKIQGL